MKKFILLTAIAAALPSCSKEESNPAEPTPPKSEPVAVKDKAVQEIRLPAVGDQWIYDLHTELNPDTLSLQEGGMANNTKPVDSDRIIDVVEQIPAKGDTPALMKQTTTEGGKLIATEFFEYAPNLVRIHSLLPNVKMPDGTAAEEIVFDPPYTIIPTELAPGYRWIENHDLGPIPIVDALTVVSLDKVTIPAGDYVCWQIRQTRTMGTSTSFKETYWYSPGVGIIRSETERYDGGKKMWTTVAQLRELKTAK